MPTLKGAPTENSATFCQDAASSALTMHLRYTKQAFLVTQRDTYIKQMHKRQDEECHHDGPDPLPNGIPCSMV